jgi:diadenosine tetraphosphatase ApaH/serine/threonine PP2A family protein phosphatase
MQVKKRLLLKTWHALDNKEEEELSETHDAYEELKTMVAGAATPSPKDTAESEEKRTQSDLEALSSPSDEWVDQVQTRLKQLHMLREFREHAVPHPGKGVRKDVRINSTAFKSADEDFVSDTPLPVQLSDSYCLTPEVLDKYPRALLRNLCSSRPIDVEWVMALRDELAAGRVLRAKQAEWLIMLVYELLVKEPNVNDCVVPRGGKANVVGDIHGQLPDLLTIFRLNGNPSHANVYIFNGDWVDRGRQSTECLLLLLAWKAVLPHCVFLNRGNHEAADINSRDGFERECVEKYGAGMFPLFSELFAAVPLATIIKGQPTAEGQPLPSVFVVHGGVPAKAPSIESLQALDRFHQTPPPGSVMLDMLWSDPTEHRGLFRSSRGAGYEFGPDVTYEFLKRNNMCMLVRSHECVDGGWSLAHHNMCATVFSASNYCSVVGNQGAFAIFEENLRPTFVTYYARREVLATRASIRYRHLETDVVHKLMDRIAMHRLDLISHYRGVVKENQAKAARGELDLQTSAALPCSSDVISRSQWAEGLRTVLRLNIPFLLFQDQLGLPDRGVLGDERGPINFMAFLASFQPQHALPAPPRAEAASASAAPMVDEDAAPRLSEALATLVELLFAHRYELESVFRFMDYDNDQSVTREEFICGVTALVRLFKSKVQHQLQNGGERVYSEATYTKLLGTEWGRAEMEELADLVDVNRDSVIQYTEFMEHFSYKARTTRTS